MLITAKFSSTCPCCLATIAVGSKVEWTKGSKAMHVGCAGKPAAAPRAIRQAYGQARVERQYAAWERSLGGGE